MNQLIKTTAFTPLLKLLWRSSLKTQKMKISSLKSCWTSLEENAQSCITSSDQNYSNFATTWSAHASGQT